MNNQEINQELKAQIEEFVKVCEEKGYKAMISLVKFNEDKSFEGVGFCQEGIPQEFIKETIKRYEFLIKFPPSKASNN